MATSHKRALLYRLEGHTEGMMALAFSPDGRSVLTGGEDVSARLWHMQGGERLQTVEAYRTFAYRPDGGALLTGGRGSDGWLWQRADGPGALIDLACDLLPRDLSAEEGCAMMSPLAARRVADIGCPIYPAKTPQTGGEL